MSETTSVQCVNAMLRWKCGHTACALCNRSNEKKIVQNITAFVL